MSFLWLFLYPAAYTILLYATGAIPFMIPISHQLVKDKYNLVRVLLQCEPTSIPTERDIYHHCILIVGPSPLRRLKLVLAIIGGFICIVMSPPFFLLLFWFSFYQLIKLFSSSRRRKDLKIFERDSVQISGVVHSRRSTRDDGSTSYYVTIRYEAVKFGDRYKIEKEFKSEKLYNKMGQRIRVSILSDHPRSGLPTFILKKMISTEACCPKGGRIFAVLVGFGLYFVGHWLAYDFGSNVKTDVWDWFVTSIAPLLVIPQLFVWAEKDYRSEKEALFNGPRNPIERANVVAFKKGHRRSAVPPQQQHTNISKAIKISAEEEHLVSPALFGRESSHTLTTELTDEETTAASHSDAQDNNSWEPSSLEARLRSLDR